MFSDRLYTQDRGHYGYTLNFGGKKGSTSLQNSLFEHNSKSRSVSGRRKNRSTSLQNSLFEHNSKSRSVSGRRKNRSTSLQNSLFEHKVFLEGEKTTQLRSKTASSSTTLFSWSLHGHYAVITRSLRGHCGHYAVMRSLRGRYGHSRSLRSLRGHYAVTTVTTRSLRSLRGHYGHYDYAVTTRSLRSLRSLPWSLRGHYACTVTTRSLRSLRGHYGHYAVTTVTTRSLRGHYHYGHCAVTTVKKTLNFAPKRTVDQDIVVPLISLMFQNGFIIRKSVLSLIQ